MENKIKVWIVNYYTSPPKYTSNPRHLKFASYLQENGYDVTIVSSSYLRKQKIDLITDKRKYIFTKYDNLTFLHVKVNKNQGNGFKRMFSIFQFSFRLYKNRLNFEKPNIVVHNIHAPFDYYICKFSKKIGAKYIAEAWDLWPEAFIDSGLVCKNNILLPFFYKYERKMYEKANSIIFSMEGGKNYLIDKKWNLENGGNVDLNKVYYINNGVDIEEFENNKKNNILYDSELENDKVFKVLFVGSLRRGTDIKLLLNAAFLLNKVDNIRFYIYGDGSERTLAEQYCKDNSIDNVVFKSKWLEFKYLPYILSKSSLNILNYKKSNRGKYGVSPGKLFLYLASGKPIVSNNKLNYCIINNNNLGISDDLTSPQNYADAILKIKNLSTQDYDSMCKRVEITSKKYDYKVLAAKFLDVINK